MDTEKGAQPATTTDSKRTLKQKRVNVVFRFLTFASALSAFVVMITDKQSANVTVFTGPNLVPVTLKGWAKYHYSKAFVWFVVANGVAFSYALITLLLTLFVRSVKLARIRLVLDLLVAFMLMSAASAATAVAYVGHHGLHQAQWNSICGTFSRYCHHVLGALVASFHAWLYLTFIVLSSLRHKHH